MSGDDTSIAARICSSWAFRPRRSRRPAPSRSAAGAIRRPRPSAPWPRHGARARSVENSLSAASAPSSSRRIWLLLMTSSAPSGSVTAAPVAASIALLALHHEDLVAGDLHVVVEHGLHEAPGRRRRVRAMRAAPRCVLRFHRRPGRAPAAASARGWRARHRTAPAAGPHRRASSGTASRRIHAGSQPRPAVHEHPGGFTSGDGPEGPADHFFSGSSFFLSLPSMYGLHGLAFTGPGSSTPR